jgi:hypothetical protein
MIRHTPTDNIHSGKGYIFSNVRLADICLSSDDEDDDDDDLLFSSEICGR